MVYLKMLAGRFRVQGLPTVIVFKDGKPVDTLVGYQDAEELRKVIEKHL